jgi:small subunit ribosomal protein S10
MVETKTKEKTAKTAAKKTVKKVTKKQTVDKLRIHVRAYEHKLLDISTKQIIDTAKRFDAEVRGPVPMPTEVKKYTVNRSTFVHKDAREQFELRVHKRLIDILHPEAKVIEALTNISLPSGVSIDVKMV